MINYSENVQRIMKKISTPTGVCRVSSSGRVFTGTRELVLSRGVGDHVMCNIGRKRYSVARFVCGAYHGPSSPKAVVIHKDCDNSNNNANNLRWGSRSEAAMVDRPSWWEGVLALPETTKF